MDPNATLRIVQDKSNDRSERRKAATDLYHWIVSGGFPPHGIDPFRLATLLKETMSKGK